jgi:hypothetical protein
MRCTNLAHISPSVIDLTCFAASVGLLPTMLAIVSGSALGVPQVHDIDTCAPRITTMTTSSTAMAGRIRCTAHLIETTYETTTTGQKGDDVSNADELHNLLRALINDTLSKPRQPPRPYAASRKDARIRPLFTLGHDTSHFLYSHYCCCSAVPCRSRLRLVFINTSFAIASSPHHVMATVTLHTNSTALKK